jgi:DNA-binding response OmpR family regulator
VVKPFGLQELLARIRAVLRRRVRDSSTVRFSDTVVDLTGPVPTAQSLEDLLWSVLLLPEFQFVR